MTGQESFDGDETGSVGLGVAIALVNDLSPAEVGAAEVIERILAVDTPSIQQLRPHHAAGFVALAAELDEIVDALAAVDLDTAAPLVNSLLDRHSVQPHLDRDPDGVWRLHHHPPNAELVAMWTAITGDALARLVGGGDAERIGRCEAHGCRCAFLDRSRNGSRRFCSLGCQNRTKAAAYRRRQNV